MKNVIWLGSSRLDLREFPASVQDASFAIIGLQLFYPQQGRRADDWKPINTVGQGVEEIRMRDATGAFRVIYYARRADSIYVLHAFQKKTQQTPLQDLRLAKKRFLEIEG